MTQKRKRDYENGKFDTACFRYYNLNPAGLITSDCSTRTIASALGITYGEAIDMQGDAAKRLYLGLTDADLVETVLLEHGFRRVKMSAVGNGDCRMNAGECAHENTADGRHVCVMRLAGHFTVARNGKVEDIWNCSSKTVYRYYLKSA